MFNSISAIENFKVDPRVLKLEQKDGGQVLKLDGRQICCFTHIEDALKCCERVIVFDDGHKTVVRNIRKLDSDGWGKDTPLGGNWGETMHNFVEPLDDYDEQHIYFYMDMMKNSYEQIGEGNYYHTWYIKPEYENGKTVNKKYCAGVNSWIEIAVINRLYKEFGWNVTMEQVRKAVETVNQIALDY